VASDDIVSAVPATPGVLDGDVAQIWAGAGASFRVFSVTGDAEVTPHATVTIDLLVVLAGEVLLDLDQGAVVLRAGDTIVQDGAAHAWRSCSPEPATVAVVLLDRPPAAEGT
jgi:quercetin dioxygenase-like cupin family protein